jgi:hypothetical protein
MYALPTLCYFAMARSEISHQLFLFSSSKFPKIATPRRRFQTCNAGGEPSHPAMTLQPVKWWSECPIPNTACKVRGLNPAHFNPQNIMEDLPVRVSTCSPQLLSFECSIARMLGYDYVAKVAVCWIRTKCTRNEWRLYDSSQTEGSKNFPQTAVTREVGVLHKDESGTRDHECQ